MAIRKVDGFILKRIPFRDTSLLVTIFSLEQGKVKLVAKGVRKDRKAVMGAFEPFSEVTVNYYEKLRSDIHLLSGISVLNANSELRSKLIQFSHISYFSELIDTLFGPHDPHPRFYVFLKKIVELLRVVPPEKLARLFEVQLLKEVGFLPVMDSCVNCGKTGADSWYFSAKQGGLLCEKCERKEAAAIPVSLEVSRWYHLLLEGVVDLQIASEMDIQVCGHLERIFRRFLEHRVEFPLRSRRFLSEVQNLLQRT